MKDKVKIKDVVNLINGYSFSTTDRDDIGYKIIRIQNLNNPLATYNRTTKKVAEKYFVEQGDILIAWSASLGVYEWVYDEKTLLNQHIFKVQFKTNNLDKSYFKYIIELAFKELEHKMRGVGLKHLTKTQLDNYEFVLPPIEEQKRRAKILNQIQELINKRTKTIDLLDEYIKSVFLEMFGDPIENTKKIKKSDKGDFKFVNGYAFKSSDFCEIGIPLIKINQVSTKNIDSTNLTFLPTDFESKYNRYIINNQDLIFSLTGTYGKNDYADVSLAKSQKYDAFLLNQRVAKIEYKEDVYDKFFLYQLFKINGVKEFIAKTSRGVRLVNLSTNKINDLNFIKPKIESQKIFSNLFNLVLTQKEKNQKSLTLLEELFQSVLYQTFHKKQEIKEDEIDKLINDELEIDVLLADMKNTEMFDTYTQYNIAKNKLFNVLERTELKITDSNKKGKFFSKGLIQKLNKRSIELNYNEPLKPIKHEVS